MVFTIWAGSLVAMTSPLQGEGHRCKSCPAHFIYAVVVQWPSMEPCQGFDPGSNPGYRSFKKIFILFNLQFLQWIIIIK